MVPPPCNAEFLMYTIFDCLRVVFKFKNSRKSNNGTDVNAGQIPQLLYRLPSQDTSATLHKTEAVEPAHVLSRDFSRTVSPVSWKDKNINIP